MGIVSALRRQRDALLLRQAINDGLVLGHDVRIMGRPEFGSEPCLVSIGDHITISVNVKFVTHDGATWVFRDRPEYLRLQRFGRIGIGDNCFIGAGAILMPGIRIGPNSVVAAGAVVTRSVSAQHGSATLTSNPSLHTSAAPRTPSTRVRSCTTSSNIMSPSR